MKKLSISLLLLAVFTLGAAAQEKSFNKSVSISLGGEPTLVSENPFSNNYNPYSLAGIYEPTWDSPTYLPVFGLDGDWILGRWIGISLSLSYTALKAEKLDLNSESLGWSKARQIFLVPGIKAYWANRERFKLYSGLDLGAEARWIIDDGKPDFSIAAAWDIVPIGVRFKFIDDFGLYIFVEGMTGRRVLGSRFGVGFAF